MADFGPVRLFLPGSFAAMSEDLREAFTRVAPGAELWFHRFMPSGVLAREILDGAAADVAVSANIPFMAQLWQGGLIAAPHILVGNRLCLIVQPERAGTVRSLDDVSRDDIRLVVPQSATDPCGQYVVELFARAGLTDVMRKKAAAGTLVHSVGSRDLPAFLVAGRADAGILYASEANSLGAQVATIALPAPFDLRDRIAFVVGAVARADRSHPLAQAFVDYLIGPVGQALLAKQGFLPAAAVTVTDLPWSLPVPKAGSRTE